MNPARSACLIAILMAMTCGVRATEAQEAWGGNPQVLWVTAWEFVHSHDGHLVGLPGTVQYVQPNVTTGVWRAPLRLPAGTWIDLMQCFFYSDGDSSLSQAHVAAYEFDLQTKVETTDLLGFDVTSPQATGYHEPTASHAGSGEPLVRYHPTETGRRFYLIFLSLPDLNDGFRGCEVTWHTTVRDTDGQTFTDVSPVDPRHAFVEALAAAGISDGCGGGNYCPDDPVTRAQLAVFLAKALGLYWPD